MRPADFSDPSAAKKLAEAIRREAPDREIKLMEVCGTHTMAIAKAGIRSILPENVRLLSGPGCPVCVTPSGTIDAILDLSREKDVVITTYGDMLRVPGSRPGTSLMRNRAEGADVRIVYSPMDAVDMAEEEPGKQFVFLGVGFETTAPGTAAALLSAKDRGVANFSVYSMLKTVEPALTALHASPDFDIDGFLCPGHVGTIIGEAGLRFIPEKLGLPAVIAGFEPLDLLASILMLVRLIAAGKAELLNEYTRAVSPDGNPLAMALVDKCLVPQDDSWRGLGRIPLSGLGIRDEFSAHDAQKRFGLVPREAEERTPCRCGEVIRGVLRPEQCPLFGRACVPEEPVGPCMVSSEGACAAAYKYRQI